MANLDLDIDFNGFDNDILQESKSERVDIYPRVVRYASKKGISKRAVDNMMLEISGGYSNFDEAPIKKQAEVYCESQYEECLKKPKTGDFGDCGDKLQPCKDKFLADKLKELKKSKNKNFWNTLLGTVNQVGQAVNKNNTQVSNTGNTNTNTNTNNDDNDDTEATILGMKPLVFTIVALGTVTTLAIITVLLMKRGKTPKK